MSITATQLKEIRQEFATLKPATVTLDENEALAWIGQPPMKEQDSGCATCK